jgi:hypothetical protein
MLFGKHLMLEQAHLKNPPHFIVKLDKTTFSCFTGKCRLICRVYDVD